MISLRQRMIWAGVLASAAFAASAQNPAPPAAGPAPQKQSQAAVPPAADGKPADKAGAKRDPAQRFERMQQRRAERQAQLKAKLQLTAAQEAAWTTYTTALQPPARVKPEDRRARREEFAKLTTPQRIERMQARQAERSARANQRAEATKAFYAQLTPQQQKTFDTESMHGFGRHGGKHRGHGAHGEHGGKADAAAPAKS